MSIKFGCECGKRFSLGDEYAGKLAICPECMRSFRFPPAGTDHSVGRAFPESDELPQPVPPPLKRLSGDNGEGLFPARPRPPKLDGLSHKKKPRPSWKDRAVVIGAAVPPLILVAFFGYVAWPHRREVAKGKQPPERSTIAPEYVGAPEGEPPAEPPKEPAAPDPAAPAKVNLAPGVPDVIGADPAPRLAMPVVALPDKGMAKDEATADLRGPVPQVGFKFREVRRIECRRTDRFTNSDGRAVPVTGHIQGDSESLYTVEDVVNDAVVKYRTKVIRGATRFSYVEPGRRRRTVERIDDLAGEVVVSERARNGWWHALLENEASVEQQQALIRLRSPFEERDDLPSGKQKLRTSWEVDAIQIKRLLGSGVRAVSGKLRATFARLEEFQDDKCAVIEYKGTVRVRCAPEEVLQERMEACDLELVTYRSTKYGIAIKTIENSITKSKGRMRIDDQEAEFQGSGRMQVTYQVTVEQ